MKTMNVENQALNGENYEDTLRSLVSSIVEPSKGLLVNKVEVTPNENQLPEKTTKEDE